MTRTPQEIAEEVLGQTGDPSFQSPGWWTTRAQKLARAVKELTENLDLANQAQVMGAAVCRGWIERATKAEANQRTPGSVEICSKCGYGKTFRPMPDIPVDVQCWDDCDDSECPIKRAAEGRG